MQPHLRDRILRHLETLPDERGYQVLDFIEFLESRYAERTPVSANVFQRFTEGVEDTLRAGRVSTAAIAETMGLLNKAVGVLSGVAAAGRSVASDLVSAASRAASDQRDAAVPDTPPPPATEGGSGTAPPSRAQPPE